MTLWYLFAYGIKIFEKGPLRTKKGKSILKYAWPWHHF